MSFPRILSLALGIGIFASSCFTTLAAPGAPRLELITEGQPFPHTSWQRVLQRFVDDEGRVDYAALANDRADLDEAVALYAAVGPKTRPQLFPTRADQLAYYLNAYNALVVWQVIERWPLESVSDAKKSFFYFTRLPLDGGAINLYGLENAVVRKRFDEPRVHFALNCASVGCPKLPREAFQPEHLEEQLAREAARFLHEARNVRLEDGAVVLSMVFDWFAQDFRPSPLEWIRAAAPDLALPTDATVRYTAWDWSLNRQPTGE